MREENVLFWAGEGSKNVFSDVTHAGGATADNLFKPLRNTEDHTCCYTHTHIHTRVHVFELPLGIRRFPQHP